ncbi:MAG: permease-like cell division protein FtsX, partial [Butyrivibrio sp.]|nr:permease-like cell division protein FtsX [Butyrivibrio sp.]
MSRFGYNLKQSFSQMNRNKGMYFTSTMAITAMMLILGLFFVTFVNINLFATTIEKDYNVIQLYLAEGSTEETAQSVGAQLEAMNGVDHITYVTKDQALETLKERWGENGYLLENLPENPLPDSYSVYVKDKDAANRVAI